MKLFTAIDTWIIGFDVVDVRLGLKLKSFDPVVPFGLVLFIEIVPPSLQAFKILFGILTTALPTDAPSTQLSFTSSEGGECLLLFFLATFATIHLNLLWWFYT